MLLISSSELIRWQAIFLYMHLFELVHGFKKIRIRGGSAHELLQRCQLDPKGASGLGHVVAQIRDIHIDASAYLTTQ